MWSLFPQTCRFIESSLVQPLDSTLLGTKWARKVFTTPNVAILERQPASTVERCVDAQVADTTLDLLLILNYTVCTRMKTMYTQPECACWAPYTNWDVTIWVTWNITLLKPTRSFLGHWVLQKQAVDTTLTYYQLYVEHVTRTHDIRTILKRYYNLIVTSSIAIAASTFRNRYIVCTHYPLLLTKWSNMWFVLQWKLIHYVVIA